MKLGKCIFPAAGYGTRFLPITKAIPKEMLPIVDKPLIHYGVDEAIAAGLTDISIIVSRGKFAISNYFDFHPDLEKVLSHRPRELQRLREVHQLLDQARFSYTRQNHIAGLGDALLSAEHLAGESSFTVILADDLCVPPGPMTRMVEVHRRFGCNVVAVEPVAEERLGQYGVIAGEPLPEAGCEDLLKVQAMVEKPPPGQAPGRLGIIGRYVLTQEIFPLLHEQQDRQDEQPGRELQLTEALAVLAQQGQVIACRYPGKRFDCGSVDGFVAATRHFHELRREQQAEADEESG